MTRIFFSPSTTSPFAVMPLRRPVSPLRNPGGILIEHEDCFVGMEPWVTFLSVGQIDRFERCDRMFFVAQLMTGLKCRPHTIIDLVNFRPRFAKRPQPSVPCQ